MASYPYANSSVLIDSTSAGATVGPRCRLGLGPSDAAEPAARGAGSEPARLLLELQLGAGAALVAARGSGFVRELTSFGWDLGVQLGAQLLVKARRAPVAPFLGAQLTGYLRPQALRVLGSDATARLPAFDVLLTAGLQVGRIGPAVPRSQTGGPTDASGRVPSGL